MSDQIDAVSSVEINCVETNSAVELSKHPQGSFVNYFAFNQHAITAVVIEGELLGWKMHPDTDELFLVANGKRRIQILYCKQTENIRVDAGSILVVAANCT